MYLEAFLPFMIRVILGILFFFQAYDIIFRIGMKTTCATICKGCEDRNIPYWFVNLSVMLSTGIEFVAGAALVLGLFKSSAMILLGINLIMTTLGFSYLKGLWDMQHLFPRLILLSALFLIPYEWDIWTIDQLLNINFPK